MADTLFVHGNFAVKTIERLYRVQVRPEQVIDTLVLAPRLRPDLDGHGLTMWASRQGIRRAVFKGCPIWTPVAEQHCRRDCYIVAGLYKTLSVIPAVA